MAGADLRSDYVSQDPTLMFYTQVLHLNSLHWGLWEPDEAISVEQMRHAQQRFTEHLASFIPDGVKKILDVGCGVGDNARHLHSLGYEVTALSPDINHQRAFEQMALPGVKFVRTQFGKFSTDEQFDLILMSESNCYFGIEICFQQCDRLLRDGGYILTASLFRKSRESSRDYRYHVMDDWLAGAEKHGYKVVQFDDITERALPTLKFFHHIHSHYSVPAIRMMLRMVQLAPGRRMKLVRWLLRNHLEAAANAPLKEALAKADPDRFRREGVYTIHLLQKGGASE